MIDFAAWKVRGPVHTLRTEHAEWDFSECTWQAPRGVSTVTFRRDGQPCEWEYHNPDGSVARSARVYDDNGQLLEEQFWRNDEPGRRVIYTYDALGRLASAEAIDPDGTRRETERYRYDDAGRKTKVTFLPRGTDTPFFYGVEGTEHSYGVPGAATLTVGYDDRGLPAEASFHDANGGLVQSIAFSRDHEGRLLREVVRLGDESPFPELQAHEDGVPLEQASLAAALKVAFSDRVFCDTAYSYDTRGRLLERTMSMGTLSEDRTTFQYDDHDDAIGETSSSRNRQMSVTDGVVSTTDDEPRLQQENRYDYEYDSHGNWTERVVSYAIGLQRVFQRSNVERRTITYYELDACDEERMHGGLERTR